MDESLVRAAARLLLVTGAAIVGLVVANAAWAIGGLVAAVHDAPTASVFSAAHLAESDM